MSTLTTLNIDALLKKDIDGKVLEWLLVNKDKELINDSDVFDKLIPHELLKYSGAHILNVCGFEDDDDYYSFVELINGDYRLTVRLTSKDKDYGLEALLKFLIPFMNIQFSKAYIYNDYTDCGYGINLKKTLEEEGNNLSLLDPINHIEDDEFYY